MNIFLYNKGVFKGGTHFRIRLSSGRTVTGLWAGQPRRPDLFPDRDKIFLHSAQTATGAHPFSYCNGYHETPSRGWGRVIKRPRLGANHSPRSKCRGLECVKLCLHSPTHRHYTVVSQAQEQLYFLRIDKLHSTYRTIYHKEHTCATLSFSRGLNTFSGALRSTTQKIEDFK